jgi:hypothetical protein
LEIVLLYTQATQSAPATDARELRRNFKKPQTAVISHCLIIFSFLRYVFEDILLQTNDVCQAKKHQRSLSPTDANIDPSLEAVDVDHTLDIPEEE